MLAPGMRRTAQRTMVYTAIVRLGGHCTADEIATELRRTKPGFSRSTVYRALEALTASGSVYAAHLGDGPTHYELASGDHHHAVCQVCGGVLHIQEELVSSLESHLADLHHFKPVHTEVLVVGVCDACSRAPGRKRAHRHTLEHVHHTGTAPGS
ncbi:MAG TPA: transcriptional repressor [Candidatus Dormibacteraeota bacterium]|nr:transcriptional repressor [Candidatus Dormibacteraeota bacterium]